MPIIQKTGGPDWRRRTMPKQIAIWFGWLIGLATTVYAGSRIADNDLLWVYLPSVGKEATDMVARMVPPKWSYMDMLWWPVWDTLNIATIGTVIAMIIAVPVAFLAAINTTPRMDWRRRTMPKQIAIWFGWLIGLATTVYAGSRIADNDLLWVYLPSVGKEATDMVARMVPPKWSYMDMLWWPVWDTLNIATIGTVIAMIIAVPVAFLAAINTTPHKGLRAVALFIIVASRSVNSLIWALALVFILGPGVLAGTIAIALRSIGGCSKLLYEAIEEIDHTQVEAIEATGASRLQQMAYGVVPQVLPTFAGVGVFRWDINVRGSTILGLVGAGGIGLQLSSSMGILAWTQVSMILLVILVTVVVSEFISAKVRHAII